MNSDAVVFGVVLVMLALGLGSGGPSWPPGWVFPLSDRAGARALVSQEFKRPGHLGVDLMYRNASGWYLPPDTLVVAARDGVVRSTGRTARGQNVVLDHAGGWRTFYQHLDAVAVVQGQDVKAGDALGTAGIDPTDGGQVRHLHFATWYDGWGDAASVDPTAQMQTWRHVTST